ncbi:MAG TPA: class I SAM-dependent methyltransferase [Bacillota bacterium]
MTLDPRWWPLLVLAGLLLVVAGSLLLPGFHGGVWSPSPRDVVRTMLGLARPRAGERLVDLGCGDGRILLTAAREFGLSCTGFDMNPFWRRWVAWQSRRAGVADRVLVRTEDFFRADLAEADIVTAFLSQAACDRLAPRLRRQLRPGARVVTYQRTLPGWDPEAVQEVRPGKFVYLYRQHA